MSERSSVAALNAVDEEEEQEDIQKEGRRRKEAMQNFQELEQRLTQRN